MVAWDLNLSWDPFAPEKHKESKNARWFKSCPFHPLVGGHLTFPKGHLAIPKRSRLESPGYASFREFRRQWFVLGLDTRQLECAYPWFNSMFQLQLCPTYRSRRARFAGVPKECRDGLWFQGGQKTLMYGVRFNGFAGRWWSVKLESCVDTLRATNSSHDYIRIDAWKIGRVPFWALSIFGGEHVRFRECR